jgi:hypothetical protein
MQAAKGNRYGQRDATMILVAYRHGLRAAIAETAVRLSAFRTDAGTPGRQVESEEALSALQGGAVDGAQARRSQASARHTGADGDPTGSQSALVARLRYGHFG